jgi:HSP20 family molecular chaperone IbpA
MDSRFSRYWTWSDAFEMLARAERMHRQFIRPIGPPAAVAWEPPVDVLETERAVLVFVALPGVDLDKADASIEGDELVFSGLRTFPAEMQTAVIHRLELPQGRFERRVRLPPGRYSAINRSAEKGCLLVTLKKAGAADE